MELGVPGGHGARHLYGLRNTGRSKTKKGRKLCPSLSRPSRITLSSSTLLAAPTSRSRPSRRSLKPPERILDWLARKGLLSEPEQEGEEGARAESGLLDEEFDLDEADEEGGGMGDAPLIDQKELGGATMSDFL